MLRVSSRRLSLVAAVVVATVVGSSAVASPASAVSPTPVISALNVRSGALVGGHPVAITGSRLAGVTAVVFGTTRAMVLRGATATRIVVTVPRHSAGTVDVRVSTKYGTSAKRTADHFTYVAPPVITAVSPATGPTTGGNTITVTGRNFQAITTVRVGDDQVTSLRVTSTTSLTAVVPPTPSEIVLPVQVHGAYGTSAATTADRYSYRLPPTLTVSNVVAPTPIPNSTLSLAATACLSAECFAVGRDIYDGSDYPVIESNYGNGWTAQVPDPPNDNADDGRLSALSCFVDGCTAVGSLTVGTSSTRFPLIYAFNGDTWIGNSAEQPAGATSSSYSAVACSAHDHCVAAGSSTAGPIVASYLGSQWTSVLAPVPAGTTGNVVLTAAGCTRDGHCVIVGFAPTAAGSEPIAEQFDGTDWTAIVLPSPGATVTSALPLTLSCATATTCVAVGSSDSPAGSGSFLSSYTAGHAWTTVAAPVPSDAVSGSSAFAQLETISCTGGTCVAAGSYASRTGTEGYTVTGSAGRWTTTSVRQATEASGSGRDLSGVACAQTGSCLFSGELTPATGEGTAFLEAHAPGGVLRRDVPPANNQPDGSVTVSKLACDGSASGTCAAISRVGSTTTLITVLTAQF